MPSPFHEGERLVQQRAGVRERIEKIGRIVFRDFMPDEHREFFAMLPYLLARQPRCPGEAVGFGAGWSSRIRLLAGPPHAPR